jgi:hypothetical protein
MTVRIAQQDWRGDQARIIVILEEVEAGKGIGDALETNQKLASEAGCISSSVELWWNRQSSKDLNFRQVVCGPIKE